MELSTEESFVAISCVSSGQMKRYRTQNLKRIGLNLCLTPAAAEPYLRLIDVGNLDLH